MNFHSLQKNFLFLFLILVITLSVSGCVGSDDGSTVTDSTTSKTVEVNGTIPTPAPAPAAPLASSEPYAAGLFNSQNSVLAVDSNNSDLIIGSVAVNGASYTANIPTSQTVRGAKIIIKNNASKRILYQCLTGKIPASSEIPDKVKKIKLSGIAVDENSTARALLAFEKKIDLLSIISSATQEIQAAGETLNLNYEGKKTPADEQIEKNCGGPAIVTELAKAVKTVAAVADSNISQSFKSVFIPGNISGVSDLLNTFITLVKNTEALNIIKQNQLSTSITFSGTTIDSNSDHNGSLKEFTNKIIPLEKVATPKFSHAEGLYNYTKEVTISCETLGAKIKYYLAYPGKIGLTNYIDYDGKPVIISSSASITAIASKDGMADSDAAYATYNIDAIPPVLTYVGMVSENTTNIYTARPGNIVKLSFTINEPLGGIPGVKINGHIVTAAKVDDLNYTASYTLGTNEVEGNVNYSIDFIDLAGNIANTVNKVSGIKYYSINPVNTLKGCVIYASSSKTGAAGNAAEGATIELIKKSEPNSFPAFSTQTSKSGFFNFTGILPGEYILSAISENNPGNAVLKNESLVSITTEKNEYLIDKPIELLKTSTLEVTVKDESGAQLQSARVFLNGLKNQYTNKNGIINFTRVPEGIYKVEILKEGFITVTQNVAVSEADTKKTFILSSPNPQIKILSVSEILLNNDKLEIYEGDTLAVAVTSDNPNGANLKFTWQISGGIIENTTETAINNLTKSEIEWTAPAIETENADTSSNYSITVTVEDGKSPSISRTTLLKVIKKSARKMSITSTPPATAVINNTYHYKIIAADETINVIEPSSLSYDIKSNHSVENDKSFTLNKDSGEITWQPAVRGTYDFILKVSDPAGNYAIQQFSVRIDDYIDELKPGETFSKTVLKPDSGLDIIIKNLTASEYIIAMPYNTSETDISSFNMSFYKTNADNSIPQMISSVAPSRAPGFDRDIFSDKMDMQFNYELKKRKSDFEFLKRFGKLIDYSRPVKAPSMQAAEPVIGSQKDFMITTPDSSINNGWAKTPATLTAYGKHCYIYLENEVPSNFIKPDSETLKKFAASFDADYEKITSVFGSEPNPGLDGDSRVYILFSHYVNLDDAAGYFSFFDTITQKKFDEASDPNLYGNNGTGQKYYSNEKEMFYIFLPDAGFNGRFYEEFVGSVLAHEFQHMVNFYQHSLVINDYFDVSTASQDAFLSYLWINEGLSMLTEDICGYNDAFRYYRTFLARVESTSLLNFIDISNYGLSYLFVKYLVERGASPAILAKSDKIDIKNAEAEIISKNIAANFDDLYGDFISTLYLSNSGITSEPKFNFATISLRTEMETRERRLSVNGADIIAELVSPASYKGVCKEKYSFNVIKCAASEPGDHKLTVSGAIEGKTGVVILRIKK